MKKPKNIFSNQYYYFDPEISKRIILALRGNKELLKEIYGKVLKMMGFLEEQRVDGRTWFSDGKRRGRDFY